MKADGATPRPGQPIAEVVIDVFAEEVDRPFDYLIPDHLLDRVLPGCRVRVPFGSRQSRGIVVTLKKMSAVRNERLKAVSSLIDDEPLLDSHLLELSRWLADYYLCTWAEALRAVLPQGTWATSAKATPAAGAGALKPKSVARASLSASTLALGQEGLLALTESLAAKGPAQARAIGFLAQSSGASAGGVDLALLSRQTGVKRPTIDALVAKGLVELREVPVARRPDMLQAAIAAACATASRAADAGLEPLTLNEAQESALHHIEAGLRQPGSQPSAAKPVLLFGVTGSGKTEVYLRAIAKALELELGTIALVPEIALTPQTVARFAGRFGERVALLHSGLSPGERRDEWLRVKNGEATVVVGTRSAVFSPVRNLGLIVIDEEHEHSYKQEEDPKYRAHEVAAWRAGRFGAALVLGSATPSVETFWRAEAGRIDMVSLPDRVARRPLPPVEVVDLRQRRPARARSLFSDALEEAVRATADRGEQALLFLNRRGYARFLLCQECGHVVGCPNCAVSLTYHAESGRLTCHYCGHSRTPPGLCPACGSPHIRQFGAGTERVEREIALLFPGAVVERLDLDSARRKGEYERILGAFSRGEIQILVGTQMIAKGLDLPRVTTVGVIDADTALYLPDFRAAERTFQLLTQVAGRAGRGDLPGKVVVQTFTPGHYAIQTAAGHDYASFYREEIRVRRELGNPPFVEMITCQVSSPSAQEAVETANRLASSWLSRRQGQGATQPLATLPPTHSPAPATPSPPPSFRVFGPTPAPVVKVDGRYRFLLVGRGRALRPMREALKEALAEARSEAPRTVRFTVNVQPLSVL